MPTETRSAVPGNVSPDVICHECGERFPAIDGRIVEHERFRQVDARNGRRERCYGAGTKPRKEGA